MTQFANRSVEFEFKLNARTGFEELPKEFDKASVDVQANIRQQNKILQEKFKGAFSQAIDDVKAKFPEFVDEFELMGDNVENILSQISKVFHGSQKDFDMLPKHMKYVAERMFELTKDTKDGLGLNVMVSNMFKGFRRKIDEELNKNKGKIKADFISEDITSNLKNVLANLPEQIKDAQKLLGKGHFELAISANLEEVHKKINEFIEKISNERNTPKPIIEQKVYNDLSEQAAQGDRYAQLLVNTWEGATREIDNFINKAHDAISYLGASPQKLLPALNNMYKGVQKIDPVTGKVTEKFKALYDAGKQLGSLVFDNLTKRSEPSHD